MSNQYVWSIWYADLRLSNPTRDRKDVLKSALRAYETSSKSYTTFIRAYAKLLVDEVKLSSFKPRNIWL